MHYQTFSDHIPEEFPIAILTAKLEQDGIFREYIQPACLKPEEVIAYQVPPEPGKKKPSMSYAKTFLDDLLPVLGDMGTKYLVVGDGEYFKALTGVAKTEAYLGYVLPNSYPENMVGQFNVIFVPNFRQVFYNPLPVKAKIKQGFDALWDHRRGLYREPGNNIIQFSAYPSTVTDISVWLEKLLEMDRPLTCDIEGFSLKHYSAGIGTISFAWSKSEGIAFPVDLSSNPVEIRKLLISFFLRFKQRMKYHNASYDVTVLIYQLFMQNILDTKGLLHGLEIMLSNFDCTKIISYLATNSCAGNNLGLKDQSQEYTGNYAVEEIKDITKIPLPELLEYNLIDAMATWYVEEKNYPIMVADQQEDLYEELFKPSLIDIIQMQLTGMPLDMEKVKEAKRVLGEDRADALRRIQSLGYVQDFVDLLNQEWVVKRNSELKVKRVSLADASEEFNPNSSIQMQRLLYEQLELPVLERTKTNAPKTGGDTLAKLMARTEDPDTLFLLRALIDFKEVDKIYGTFIPAMEEAVEAPDGSFWLFGNFNLGGTVSGRLSSSEPNLQTIPSKGRYAKLIKDCFRAPGDLVMCGLDFDALEDKISALTTKDSNKLKVYLDGYDGHCLRAFSYFREKMPDIQDTLESINSIKDLHDGLRSASKTPTFLLTYGGTFIGLIAKCGFSLAQAKEIEARYHELYKESDEWVAERIEEACKVGFITAAFGLRVRTPLLHQVVRGNSATPYEAEAEARTAGNALGQSWCLLNSRASVEFMRKVRKSKYRYVIRPIAHIHDAQYYVIPNDIEVLLWVNEHLVKACQWQEDPLIQHDKVKLGGKLNLYFPSWAEEIPVPNGAGEAEVRAAIEKHEQKKREKENA